MTKYEKISLAISIALFILSLLSYLKMWKSKNKAAQVWTQRRLFSQRGDDQMNLGISFLPIYTYLPIFSRFCLYICKKKVIFLSFRTTCEACDDSESFLDRCWNKFSMTSRSWHDKFSAHLYYQEKMRF